MLYGGLKPICPRRQTPEKPPSLLWSQKLQPMAIGIVKVNAMRIAIAAEDFDARVLKQPFNTLVVPGSQPQRHVIDFASSVNVVADLEQRDALVAASQKTLP